MSRGLPEHVSDDPDLIKRLKIALKQAFVARFNESDWKELALVMDLEEEIREHPRFLRSCQWGDPDYDGHVLDLVDVIFFKRASRVGEILALPKIAAWFHSNADDLLELWKGQPDPLVDALAHGLDELTTASSGLDIDVYKRRISDALPNDPAQAVGSTKDMLEAVMRTILAERGDPNPSRHEFPSLTSACLAQLGLNQGPPNSEWDKLRNGIISNASKTVGAIGMLRNLGGTGHGRVLGQAPDISTEDAQLVAATGFILAAWLLRHHRHGD
ncbi:abortive infection family protein (plasmid) [Azospirillum oryzae]|uniref:Abortive infection family protein n=1 Tax=Azospirillum oryzae TaxID=286727 RepID=A0A6N1AE64_9PROT|nr:abortive infection family protein [Azospirillum oryzae]KAA0584511.1 abortive infection family protein [Azospirillum oryzae]QKS49806.1 abortive infection family protein [Azospirillum oryzae]GLR79068.1 hypothetical protein GCM10007856_17420 [Azospirillum oryzae]